MGSDLTVTKQQMPGFREKSLNLCMTEPYRKPTQVDKGKCPQVTGRTIVKELGKLTP